MSTTNQYLHLRGLLPSKPPSWRHRHRPRHLLYLLPFLTHLLPFRSVHHAQPTPLNTTPPVNTTPMSCSHFPPVLSLIQAYNHVIKSTPFNYPLLSFHPTIPRSLHAKTTFYLPQLPPPTAPIVTLIADPLPPTRIPHTNSYVNLFRKATCLRIHIRTPRSSKTNTQHIEPQTLPLTPPPHSETPLTPPPHSETLQVQLRQLLNTHVPPTNLTTHTRIQNLSKTNTLQIESHPPHTDTSNPPDNTSG
jgi:hypothetical protein